MNAETVNALRAKPFSAILTALTEPGASVITQYVDPDGFEVTLYRKFPGDRLRSYSRKLVEVCR